MRKIIFSLLACFLFGCKHDTYLTPLTTITPNAKTIPNVKDEYTLEKSNPWIEFIPDYQAKEGVQSLDYEFTVLADNRIYGSFILSNADSVDQTISFTLSNSVSIQLTLFEVEQVTTNSGKIFSDPILPTPLSFTLKKNKAQLFLIQIKGVSVGISNASILIDNGRQKKSISIKTSIIKPNMQLDDLNAVNWSYLHLPLIKNRIEAVGKDLHEHHINTSVVSFHVIPPIESTDFSSIIKYVSTIKDVKNILIHAYPRTNNQKAPLMSTAWKELFITWYRNMLNALNNAGYSVDHIYFYPYDEISLEKLPMLEALYTWAKSAIPNFKLYATVITNETANKIVPLIELTQLIHLHNPQLIEANYPKKGKLWLYNTFGHTYALSPYGYYRLMAWTAYYRDIEGIGFWNYADLAKKANNPITDIIDEGLNDSYSVIYTGENQEIISSRRWEAFSLGIEDYRVLRLYEQKFGKDKTKAMVGNVLVNQEQFDLADQTRDEMINAL